MYAFTRYISLLFFAFFMITGCSAPQKSKELKVVIPTPPDEPRLYHLKIIKSESDLKEKTTSFDQFLGIEAGSYNPMLAKPYGVAAKDERIYIADTASGFVVIIDLKKNEFSRLPVKLGTPVSVALQSNGIIYVSDAKTKKVLGFKETGEIVYAVGGRGKELYRPTGIAINEKLGLLYVVDTLAHNFKIYSLHDGKLLNTVGKRGEGDGEFNYPSNIAVDKRNNNIAIVDTQNFRVQLFDKDGKFISRFGKIGDRPGMFARPKGVAIDSEGHIYVADAAFDNVQIFNDQGQLMLFFGGSGFGPARFSMPGGMNFDEKDRLYIVETFSGRVQYFQYLSEAWKKANPEKYEEIKALDTVDENPTDN